MYMYVGGDPVLQRMLLLWGKQQEKVVLPEAWVLMAMPSGFYWKEVRMLLELIDTVIVCKVRTLQA